jgi:hypothetical protein
VTVKIQAAEGIGFKPSIDTVLLRGAVGPTEHQRAISSITSHKLYFGFLILKGVVRIGRLISR